MIWFDFTPWLINCGLMADACFMSTESSPYLWNRLYATVHEWIGEADSIKPLNCNRPTLEKEKCLSCVISDWWNAMAQSRDEVHTDLINRTEWLEGNGKVMIIACRRFQCTYHICFWPPLQLLRLHKQIICSGKRGHSVSNCDIPDSAATFTSWNKSIWNNHRSVCCQTSLLLLFFVVVFFCPR